MSSKEDVLDRQNFIQQVIDLTKVVSENRKSCCFAIEGEWGSGKSFVLEKIQEYLEKEKLNGRDQFFVVRYDCWEYDYYEEPVVAIISVLRDTIKSYMDLVSEETQKFIFSTAKNAITKIGIDILKAKTGIDLEGCIEKGEDNEQLYDRYFGFRDTIENVRKVLNDLTKDQTVVIIVDELDRCLPPYAIKVLERIHHIFNEMENVVVIVAMEKKQIENSLHQIYGTGMDVDQYLKKFISFSVKLDNGSARNFLTKYAGFTDMFNIQQKDEMEEFLANITSGIDIRTQEKIFEKAESMHRLVAASEKMNSEVLAFEIFTLCIKEKMTVINMEWVFEASDYPSVKQQVGEKCYHTIRTNTEYIRNHTGKMNGKYICTSDNFVHKLIFIITATVYEYRNGFCETYYCDDEKIEEEIKFEKRIYNLLTI